MKAILRRVKASESKMNVEMKAMEGRIIEETNAMEARLIEAFTNKV